MEIGNIQTLAYQKDGQWLTIETPDYGETLAQCQAEYQLYSSAEARPAKAIDCRPVMRGDPTQGTIIIDGQTYYYNDASL